MVDLPDDILEKDGKEVRDLIERREASDVLNGLTTLATNILSSLGILSPQAQATGDVISFLKENFVTSASQRKQLDFLMLLFERLKQLESKIDAEYLKKEEFEAYIQRFLDPIKHEQYEPKVEAFRSALVNIAVGKKPTNFEVEYFINSLISFSDLHFAIFSYFNSPKEILTEKGIDVNGLRAQSGGEGEVFKKVFDGVDIELVRLASKELKDKGFTSTEIPFPGMLTTQTAYDKMTKDYLTPLGKRFISFFIDDN